jgi:hypothetical protein
MGVSLSWGLVLGLVILFVFDFCISDLVFEHKNILLLFISVII